MKKVTTNMTLTQVFFILFILIVSSLMFFYLGAKFGADVLTLADRERSEAAEPFLPDEKLAAEIRSLLDARAPELVFHDVVQGKKSLQETRPSVDKAAPVLKVATVPKPEPSSPPAAVPAVERKMPPPVVPAVKTSVVQPRTVIAPRVTEEVAKTVYLPPAPSQTYRLQLGSYAQKTRALQAKAEWESRGYAARLVETTIPGKGQWFRLQFGNFTSLPDVQNAQRQIMDQFQQTAMILSVNSN